MMLTLNIAILVIVVFITLSFRNKLSVLLALIPAAPRIAGAGRSCRSCATTPP